MQKTIYRISLFEGADQLCEKIALLAAKANGGATLALSDLKNVALSNKIEYPTLYGNITPEIIGENVLHIDKKLGDEYRTACIIEATEIYELHYETL